MTHSSRIPAAVSAISCVGGSLSGGCRSLSGRRGGGGGGIGPCPSGGSLSGGRFLSAGESLYDEVQVNKSEHVPGVWAGRGWKGGGGLRSLSMAEGWGWGLSPGSRSLSRGCRYLSGGPTQPPP